MTDKKFRFKYYLLSFLLYSLGVVILLGPYFTPFSVLGPEGILRADQVLIPIVVVAVVFLNSDQFIFPNNLVVFTIATIVGIISLSIFSNSLYGGTTEVGDIFDIIIWVSYFALVATIPGNIFTEQARKTILLIVGLSVGVAILGILQWLNVGLTTDIIAPIYTTRLDKIGRQPTATLKNPNSLGKLILFLFFFSLARLYQIYVANSSPNMAQNLFIWSFLTTISAATIIMSNSRSVLIGLVFGLGIIILFILLEEIGDNKKRIRILSTIFVLTLVGLYLVIIVFEVGRITNLQNPLQDNSLSILFEKWKTILPVILERPLFGYGPSKAAQLEVGIAYIDNGILSWWYSYGLVGLITSIGIILAGIKTSLNTVLETKVFNQRPIFGRQVLQLSAGSLLL